MAGGFKLRFRLTFNRLCDSILQLSWQLNIPLQALAALSGVRPLDRSRRVGGRLVCVVTRVEIEVDAGDCFGFQAASKTSCKHVAMLRWGPMGRTLNSHLKAHFQWDSP